MMGLRGAAALTLTVPLPAKSRQDSSVEALTFPITHAI